LVSAIAVTCSPAPALAQQRLVDRPAAKQGGNNDRIIDAIQKRYHARVVRVADTQVNGRAALELRLLSDQRVWTVIVDARSGEVLSGG
jgi:uncharacterized membrane protein YkoI